MTDVQRIHQLEQHLTNYDDSAPPVNLSQQIDMLNELAWLLCDTDLKRAYRLSERAYALADPVDPAASRYHIGIVSSLRTQGYLNMRFGDYALGLTQLLKALPLAETLHLADCRVDVLDGIAGTHCMVGNYPEALDAAYKQLDAAQCIGDQRRIINAYNNLAVIYFETGDYTRNEELLQQNLKIAKAIHHTRIECITYVNLAEIYLFADDHQRAITHALRGLQLSQESGYGLFEIHALHTLSQCYLKQADASQAIVHLQKAIALSRTLDSKATEILALLTLGEAHRDLQQIEQAQTHVQRAIQIAEAIQANKERYQGHLLLAELYEQASDFAQALAHVKEHNAVKELVFNADTEKRLNVLQVAYATKAAKHEAEVAQLRTAELQQTVVEHEQVKLQLQHELGYVEALARCSQVLLTGVDQGNNQTQVLQAALEHLRGACQASRAYLFQNIQCQDQELATTFGLIAEACAPGIYQELNLTNQAYEWSLLPTAMVTALQAGKPAGGPVERLFADTPILLETFRRQRNPLLSIQCFPIFIRDHWWGFIGFDDAESPREWNEQETMVLRTAAEMVANTVNRWQTEGDLRALNALQEYQLELMRALSDFKQTLMRSTASEVESRRVLTDALHHLLKPTQAGMIVIRQNVDDPEIGPYAQQFVAAVDTTTVPLAMENTGPATFATYRALLKQKLPSLAGRSDEFVNTIVPQSLVPAAIIRQLRSGMWIGDSVSNLFADAPDLRNFLLQTLHLNALLLFPIQIAGQWWGTIIMSKVASGAPSAATDQLRNNEQQRLWTEDEILLLGTATEMIVSTLQRWQAEANLRALNERLEGQVAERTTVLRNTVHQLRTEVEERRHAEIVLQELTTSLEHRLADRMQELATFLDLTVLGGRSATVHDVIEGAMPRILEVTNSRAVCIHLFATDHQSTDRQQLRLVAEQELPHHHRVSLETVALSPAFHDWLTAPHDPLLTNELATLSILPALFRLAEFQTYLGVQIRIGRQVEGLLSCYRFTDRGFSLDDVALVMALGEQMGMVIGSHRLRKQAEDYAVLAERQRLARDLHDSVTQSLYSLSLFSRAGREAIEDGDTDRLQCSFTQAESTTLQILREMRLMLYELRPSDLEQAGLKQAIELRLSMVERRVGLQVEIQLDELQGLAAATEVELYHIIIEALNNVVKHAAATQMDIQLTQATGQLYLKLEDNGVGFDPTQSTGGMGLKNIRERVAHLNGTLAIMSQPTDGATIEIAVPYGMEEHHGTPHSHSNRR